MTRLVSALYDEAGPFMAVNTVNDYYVTGDPNALGTNDILLLHGGEDISPSLYNHAKHPYTSAPADRPGRRDRIEWALLQRAIELKIPVIGICRG